jgi:hypothetical protein
LEARAESLVNTKKKLVVAGSCAAVIFSAGVIFVYREPGFIAWHFPDLARTLHKAGVPLKGAHFYSNDALQASPSWEPTNPTPITPDQAVITATAFANSTRPAPTNWDIDEIDIEEQETKWFYNVHLVDRQSGSFELKIIRVLMNGKIWPPDPP